jgi:general secretion pathway protein A
METKVAHGTCVLLSVLLLSVRKRKMEIRIPRTFSAWPLRGSVRPIPASNSMQGLRQAMPPVPPFGILLSTGLEHTLREAPNCKMPQRSSKRPDFSRGLIGPLDFPALQVSEEAKKKSGLFHFENHAFGAPAEAPSFASPETAPAGENAHASPGPSAHVETDAARSLEIGAAASPGVANQSALGTPIAAGVSWAERIEAIAAAIAENCEPVRASSEKKAAKDVLSFYGLPQQPFDVTPDPAYLYFSPSHRDALVSLKEGIEHFRGFMVLAAEPGMGKTTLLNKLMDELSNTAQVVFLFQTQCSPRELLCFILNELEVDHAGMDIVAMHRALNQTLLEEMLRGRRFVLIVDEAQNLQEPVLETIRLLSDFETTHSKLIQIVLAGQPQLADRLRKPGLVQLRQRIAILSSLKSLSAAQTGEYVAHRLRACGWSGSVIFTPDALAQIAESSEGVPRRINNLCFNALLAGFHRREEIISAEIVKEVAEKLNLDGLFQSPEADAAPRPQPISPAGAPAEESDAVQFARALTELITAEVRPPDKNPGPRIVPKPKPEIVLTGNLTEKVLSQGWSKRPEYRIMVTLEHTSVAGAPIADRYYCCSIYLDEPQAAGLKTGKPVRIKIEQD